MTFDRYPRPIDHDQLMMFAAVVEPKRVIDHIPIDYPALYIARVVVSDNVQDIITDGTTVIYSTPMVDIVARVKGLLMSWLSAPPIPKKPMKEIEGSLFHYACLLRPPWKI